MHSTDKSILLVLFAGLAVSTPAAAQSYRCSTADSTYFSDRPCPDAQRPNFKTYGSTRGATAATPNVAPLPAAGKMQEHVKYLSPQCASISEAIRTAPSRGVRGNTISELREEYLQKCRYEEQDARRQASLAEADQNREQLAQRDVAARERRQNQARAEQCMQMRDVIRSKRAREGTLSETEVAALRSLERTYNERCTTR